MIIVSVIAVVKQRLVGTVTEAAHTDGVGRTGRDTATNTNADTDADANADTFANTERRRRPFGALLGISWVTIPTER